MSTSRTISRTRSRSNNQARLAARARRNVPAQICFPHPLSWWRVRPAYQFRKVDIAIARHLLSKSAIIGEPYWFVGAAGNAAMAINVARRAHKQSAISLVSIDVTMTAVLCVALEGDLAAALFLSASLKRQSHIDPCCAALSDGWLTYKPPWAERPCAPMSELPTPLVG